MTHGPLEILYRDDDLVVVDKPAGMLVHRTALAHGESTFALQTLRRQIGVRVQPVHRLDRPTSGVLVFALHKRATQVLSDQFTRREVRKTYWAIVRGYTEAQGEIDYPVLREDKVPQEARTVWRRLATVELPIPVGRYQTARYSWVELTPHTGRYHQLRRHCAHIRHPIIGDTTHGEGRHNRLFREHLEIGRMLLYAQSLCLTQPTSGAPLRLVAPIDPSLRALADRFNWPLEAAMEALNPG